MIEPKERATGFGIEGVASEAGRPSARENPGEPQRTEPAARTPLTDEQRARFEYQDTADEYGVPWEDLPVVQQNRIVEAVVLDREEPRPGESRTAVVVGNIAFQIGFQRSEAHDAKREVKYEDVVAKREEREATAMEKWEKASQEALDAREAHEAETPEERLAREDAIYQEALANRDDTVRGSTRRPDDAPTTRPWEAAWEERRHQAGSRVIWDSLSAENRAAWVKAVLNPDGDLPQFAESFDRLAGS